LTTAQSAVDERVADLIKRFGHGAVKAAVEEQTPPEEPPRQKHLTRRERQDVPWLQKAKEDWEACGKPGSIWPSLNRIAGQMYKENPMTQAASHAHRLYDRLNSMDILWYHREFTEFSFARTQIENIVQTIIAKTHKRQMEFYKGFCRLLSENAESVPKDKFIDELVDLLAIVRRRSGADAFLDTAEKIDVTINGIAGK
jgi:hypothetical protein